MSTLPEAGVLELDGEIDLHESPQVKARLQPLIAAKLPQILVDMDNVSYIDSSGLALFIEAMQRVQAYGGKFALCGLRPSVRTIFDIARLDQVFRISRIGKPLRRGERGGSKGDQGSNDASHGRIPSATACTTGTATEFPNCR